jgi:hypothetical protein
MAQIASNTDYPQDCEMDTRQEPRQSAGGSLSGLSQRLRSRLINGPAILLTVSHSGTQSFDYAHQCAAAQGMVHYDRTRQLREQAENNNRSFDIEFPTNALAAASPLFKQGYEANPHTERLPIDLGTVLPGYLMSVLDWYAKALQSKKWYSFVPEDASIDGDDKWYWVYCYAAMRSLYMDEFAGSLRAFIEGFFASLVTNFEDYAHLIRTLPANDPLLDKLVVHTARQMNMQTVPMSDAECAIIAEHFPEFTAKVNEAMLRF